MKINILNSVRAAAATVTAAAMIVSLAGVFPQKQEASAASTCVVNTTKQYQNIRGFGGMNLPEWISQGDLTDAQRQKAFGNGTDELGLTVLRIYVSDDKNSWSRAVPTAKFAQKMGATVFATPWNPPSSIRQNGNGSLQGGKYHLPSNQYAAYAQHLNDYYSYMKNQGVDVYSISVQNEPDYSAEWTGWTSDETTSFLANYGDQLNFRVMSPETFQYTNKDYYTKILNNSKAMANTDLFGTHFYGTQRSQMDFSALENSGKEIWMTEVYVPNSEADSANRWPEALKVSENIHNGLVVGNMSAYTWWYIRRSYGLMTEDGKISKRGYCMAQYSKFVRPGDKRIDATEQPNTNLLVSAYKDDQKHVKIVAVNTGTTDYSQEFSIGSGEKIANVDRYRTSSNENIALTSNLEFSGSNFWAQLPAQSVSTFVIDLEGAAQPTEPTEPTLDSNGYYFHDKFEGSECDWTGHGSATVTLSGRTPYKDKEALLVQDRTSAWMGVEKSISTDVFKPGKEYSFSVSAVYLEGDESQNFSLTLQYTDASGETKYAHIADATATAGNYVHLANTNFTIPSDASNTVIYVENDSKTGSFYIDEAIGAPAGTKIEGPTQPTTVATTTTTTTTTTTKALTALYGDANDNGTVEVSDAVYVLQGLADPSNSKYSLTAQGAVNADCDHVGNGVDAQDALAIQMYAAGLITKLPNN